MFSLVKNEIALMFKWQRLNRMRFAAYVSINGALFSLLDSLLNSSFYFNNATFNALFQAITWPLYIIVMLLPNYWLSRRMNDVAKSSKWMWLALIIGYTLVSIPIVFRIVCADLVAAITAEGGNVFNLFKLITALISLLGAPFIIGVIFLSFFMLFKSGTETANQYGPVPPRNNFFTTFILIIGIVSFLGLVISESMKIANLKVATEHADSVAEEQQTSSSETVSSVYI